MGNLVLLFPLWCPWLTTTACFMFDVYLKVTHENMTSCSSHCTHVTWLVACCDTSCIWNCAALHNNARTRSSLIIPLLHMTRSGVTARVENCLVKYCHRTVTTERENTRCCYGMCSVVEFFRRGSPLPYDGGGHVVLVCSRTPVRPTLELWHALPWHHWPADCLAAEEACLCLERLSLAAGHIDPGHKNIERNKGILIRANF